MSGQNILEIMLYGDSQDKKTFHEFRREAGLLDEKTKGSKKVRTRSLKDGDGTAKRMEKAYTKRQRDKKVEKLQSDSNHWKGLQ